jgi:hypothetical protein
VRVLAALHVPAGLWIAVGAALALVMGSVAAGVRWAVPDRARNKLLIALTVWLAIDAALGAIGVFAADVTRPVPGIAPGMALPILGSVWLLGRSEGVRRLLASVPLRRLIGVQVYRVAGGVFILAWASGRMPAAFALPAGLGDIAVGVTAPIAAARLDEHSPRSVARAVLWNIAGIADLVVAVTLGALTSPTPFEPIAVGHPNMLISRLPFVLIPVFAVPLSVLLHVATLRRLRAPNPDQALSSLEQSRIAA